MFVIKNVRLSFPDLFRRGMFDGKEEKYGCVLLISKKRKKTIAKIQNEIKKVKGAVVVPSDRYCFKDADEHKPDLDGYRDHWFLSVRSNRRPVIIGRNKEAINEDDGIIYAGCYVNAQVDVWLQNNSWGKRINGNLYAIQFYADGEPFGATADVNAFDSYDNTGDDDEEPPF